MICIKVYYYNLLHYYNYCTTQGAVLLCSNVWQCCTLPTVGAALVTVPPVVLVLTMLPPPVSPAHAVRPSGSPRRRT